MFRVELAGGGREQADQRRTLLGAGRVGTRCRMTPHSIDLSTRSHAMAPARTSTGTPSRSSTIVDGGPPGEGPPSRRQSMRAASDRATDAGLAVPDCPDRFALVAVIQKPKASARSGAGGRGPATPPPASRAATASSIEPRTIPRTPNLRTLEP